MKNIFRIYNIILTFLMLLLLPAEDIMAQKMTLDISNTYTAAANHVIISVTPDQDYNGALTTWTSSNITLRIKKVLSNATLVSGSPSSYITGISSAFSAMSYYDLLTNNPITSGISLYDGANIGGSADPTYWYMTISGGGGNQTFTNGTSINLLTFDLPSIWGNSPTDIIEIVSAQPASIPIGSDDMTPSITNAAYGFGNQNIVALGKTSALLPFNLSSFKSTSNGCTANLVWKTVNEINSSYFGVEVSNDGRNFSQIGKVAIMNSSLGGSYKFDYALVSGLNYFRLKMVAKDASFTYSPIVSVDGNCGNQIVISPNPVKDILHVYRLQKGSSVEVYNNVGQLMTRLAPVTFDGDIRTIDVSQYINGDYYIRIVKDNKILINSKVVKL